MFLTKKDEEFDFDTFGRSEIIIKEVIKEDVSEDIEYYEEKPCHICDTVTDTICDRCEEPACENYFPVTTQFNAGSVPPCNRCSDRLEADAEWDREWDRENE